LVKGKNRKGKKGGLVHYFRGEEKLEVGTQDQN